MAEETKTILLKVELDTAELKKRGEEASKTLDSLKVKQSLMRGESKQGTLEYAKLSQEISKTTKIVKDNAKALEIHERLTKENSGSMQDLKDEMLAGKIALNQMNKEMREGAEGQALIKNIDELNTSLKDTEQSYGQFGRDVGNYSKMTRVAAEDTGDLGQVFEDVYGELKPMTGRIGELEDRMYELALAGKTDTEQFKALQKETVALKKTILDVDKATDALAENTGITGFASNIGEAGERLLALDFKGAEQRIGALRSMSEQTNFKTIISGAKSMGSALLALGKTILANPIFLIAGVIIGAGVALKGWIDMTEQKAVRAQERHTASLERSTQAYKDQAGAIRDNGDLQLRLAVAQGKSLEDQQKLRLQNFDQAHEKEMQQLESAGKEKRNAEYILNDKRFLMDQANFYNNAKRVEDAVNARKVFDEKNEEYLDLKRQTDKFGKERVALEAETSNQIFDNEKANNEIMIAESESAYQQRLAIARRIQDLILEGQDLSYSNQVAKIEAHYKFLASSSKGGAEELLRIEANKNQELDLLNENARKLEKEKISENYKREIEDAEGNSVLIDQLKKNQILELESVDIDYDSNRKERDQNYQIRLKELDALKISEAKKTAQELEIISLELNLELNKGTQGEYEAWKALQDAKVEIVKENVENEKKAQLEIAKIKNESYKSETDTAKKTNEELVVDKKALAAAFIGITQSMVGSISQILQNQISYELEAETDKFDTQTKLLNEQLQAGLISQADFNGKKSALDAEYSLKERALKTEAFIKNKRAQEITAGINAAQATLSALASAPAPYSFILAGIAAGLGAVQVGIIESQPTPKFEKGGVFGGKPHSGGGTKGVFDDGTQVEVEKDEAFFVLNKKSSAMISKLSQLNQLGGGVPLMERGGSLKFETGGAFSASVGKDIANQQSLRNLIVDTVSSMPNPVVFVESINSGQNRVASVERANNYT